MLICTSCYNSSSWCSLNQSVLDQISKTIPHLPDRSWIFSGRCCWCIKSTGLPFKYVHHHSLSNFYLSDPGPIVSTSKMIPVHLLQSLLMISVHRILPVQSPFYVSNKRLWSLVSLWIFLQSLMHPLDRSQSLDFYQAVQWSSLKTIFFTIIEIQAVLQLQIDLLTIMTQHFQLLSLPPT